MNDIVYAVYSLASQSPCFAIDFVKQFPFEDVVACSKYELLDRNIGICRDVRQARCGNQYAFVFDTNAYNLRIRRCDTLIEDDIAIYTATEGG